MSSLTTIISIIVNTICMESQIGILKNKLEIGLICIWYCNNFCDYNFKKLILLDWNSSLTDIKVLMTKQPRI